MFNCAFSVEAILSGDGMTDELERIYMEAFVAYSRYYPSICLEGLGETTKTSVRMSGIPAEIRNKPLLNTKS
jgi:hypothetical protein